VKGVLAVLTALTVLIMAQFDPGMADGYYHPSPMRGPIRPLTAPAAWGGGRYCATDTCGRSGASAAREADGAVISIETRRPPPPLDVRPRQRLSCLRTTMEIQMRPDASSFVLACPMRDQSAAAPGAIHLVPV
jgi:hypothetical protein